MFGKITKVYRIVLCLVIVLFFSIIVFHTYTYPGIDIIFILKLSPFFILVLVLHAMIEHMYDLSQELEIYDYYYNNETKIK